MKTVICWFSGTGNSLAVAKALASAWGDTELVPLAHVQGALPPAERVGLVFPVYGWGPPAPVVRFIEQLTLPPETVVFAVATYAGTPGGTLEMVRQMLRARGLRLAAGRGVKMAENYPPLGGAPAPERQRKINAAVAQRLVGLAAELAEVRQEEAGPLASAPMRWMSRMVWPLFQRHTRRADRAFRADATCNGCGLCARICPVGNVALTDGRPVWLGHCAQCFACFHWCPQKAVQFGHSARQHRYHHPDVAASELCGIIPASAAPVRNELRG
jgi:ferredoxin